MELLTSFLPHLLHYGFIAIVCCFAFVVLVWGFGLTVAPFHWAVTKLFDTRCPECKGFFKKNLLKKEISDEHEARRTINRVDQGVLYSNNLFALNQGFEVNRQEQVTFVEQTIQNTWQCKDLACGHQWQTEEFGEFEGILRK
jgi:hypothetical protein